MLGPSRRCDKSWGRSFTAVLAVITQEVFYCDRTASLGSAPEQDAPIERILKFDYTLVTRHNPDATKCKNMLAIDFQVHSLHRFSDLALNSLEAVFA